MKIRLIGLASGEPSPFDEQYLKEYDPDRQSVDPQGRPTICRLVTTENPDEAMQFTDIIEVRNLWMRRMKDHPLEAPLSAFTIEILK